MASSYYKLNIENEFVGKMVGLFDSLVTGSDEEDLDNEEN